MSKFLLRATSTQRQDITAATAAEFFKKARPWLKKAFDKVTTPSSNFQPDPNKTGNVSGVNFQVYTTFQEACSKVAGLLDDSGISYTIGKTFSSQKLFTIDKDYSIWVSKYGHGEIYVQFVDKKSGRART